MQLVDSDVSYKIDLPKTLNTPNGVETLLLPVRSLAGGGGRETAGTGALTRDSSRLCRSNDVRSLGVL